MAPKAAPKRKASVASSTGSSDRDHDHDTKKSKATSGSSSTDLRRPHHLSKVAEEHGIVDRRFYPPEMSNARAEAYTDGDLPNPTEELERVLEATARTRLNAKTGAAVVHWFKMDLRTHDNKGLALAAEKAHEAGVPLVGLFVASPEDWEAHLRAPVRVDFMLRTLAVLQADLAKLNVPLWVETVDKRKDVPAAIARLLDQWKASHVYANMEYEVDELRRETALVQSLADAGKSLEVVHDTCIVPPGQLTSSTSGRAYAVYTPWFRAWKTYVHDHEDIVEVVGTPAKQPDALAQQVQALFDCAIPDAPASKALAPDDATKFAALWPAGEHEALRRLGDFCERKMDGYARSRDFPAQEATAAISPYLAVGSLSARTVLQTACDGAGATSLERGGSDGFRVWVSEVAWRDFYKHVLVGWPYVCMNKPFKPAYSNIAWSYDRDAFDRWTAGRTGYPLVDAAMRQLAAQGWMHNRCRMVVASFLVKDLLIDWRLGEQYFMRSLVDGDFASNNGGWGFAASVGVDPQPYFRIFNPLRQSERFDGDGAYIKHWVPELACFADGSKGLHEPYGKPDDAAKARKAGYPEPIVAHKDAREKALAAYKAALGR